MDQMPEEDQKKQVVIKKPFETKFFKQLNSIQNDKYKKSKRRLRQLTPTMIKKIEKFEALGLKQISKSIKKIPELTKNGNKIVSGWKNEQMHGEAEIHYNNGVIFKGFYQNGMKIKGHFQFSNGYEYIGNCLGNKFNGQGSLVFPSGKIITGQWKDYNLVGKGKIQYPKGEVYYGEIKDFKKHGKGYLYFNDGGKYVGQFENGLITGNGAYFMNEKPVATGRWVNGDLVQSCQLDEVKYKVLSMNFEFVQTGPQLISNILKDQQIISHVQQSNISLIFQTESREINILL